MRWNKNRVIGLVAAILAAAVAVGGIALWLGQEVEAQGMIRPEILQTAPNHSFHKLSAHSLSEDKDAAVDAAVAQVLAELDVFDASDYEKIKSVYYYVCTHVEYDHEALYDPDDFGGAGSVYNALILGKAVCSGYARLVERLLLELDVACDYVSGNRSIDGVGHAWNIVKLDGLYYIVDATNGADPIEPWDAYFLATYGDIPFEPDPWYLTDEWHAQHPMATKRYLESCSGFYSNGVAWKLDGETRVLTITGEGAIPDDLPLWDSWRQFRWAVEGISIGEGITETGKNAFDYCANAQWISLPDSLQKISDGSFGRCSKVQELHIPSAVTTIGSQAFYECESLRSLTLEGCVETIGDAAFSACETLDFIHVAVQPITIHECAFMIAIDPYWGKDQPYISAIYYDRAEDAQVIVDWSSAALCNALLSVGGTIGVPAATAQLSSFVTDKLPITSEITYNGKEYTLYSDHICIWATYTEGDAGRRYCTICDARKDVDPAAHNYAAVITEPGCFAGYTTYTCIDCGDSYVDHVTAALGHSFADWEVTVPNSCTDDGVETRTCTICGTQEERVLTKTHSWGEWYVTQEAGCSDLGENGEERRDCARCGQNETRILYATGHVWTTVVTPATCTTDGYTTYTCVCGYSYVADTVYATAHDYVANHVTQPTCTKRGYTTYVCTRCGDSYDDDYFWGWPYGHDYVAGEILQEPTCTEEGKQAYSCSVCGKEWEEPMPAAGHTIGEWYTSIEPGCYELGHDGEKRRDCANCDYHETYVLKAQWHVESYCIVVEPTCETAGRTEWYCECGYFLHYTDEVEPFWHDLVETQISEPTCTQWGQSIFSCTICDYVGEPINLYAPTGHTEVINPEVAPTCTETGLTEGKHCSVCGEVLIEQTEVAMIEHSYTSTVTAPSCTEKGYTTHTCTVCGATYTTDQVDALGHSYEETVVEATCTENGSISHTCSTCGHSYSEEIKAQGHTVAVDEAVAPTCTATGLTEGKHCDICGEILVAQEQIKALGHSHEKTVIEATCTEVGSVTYTCHCGDTYSEEIPTLGHDYGAEVTAPTCTEDGYTTHTCSRCADTYTSDVVEALGHSHEKTVIEATCTEDGSVTYTCHCGDSYTEEIPALGHRFVDGTCERCDEPEIQVGDINGDGKINARDARLLLRYAAGLVGDDEINLTAADYNGDGKINARDARAVLRFAAGLD